MWIARTFIVAIVFLILPLMAPDRSTWGPSAPDGPSVPFSQGTRGLNQDESNLLIVEVYYNAFVADEYIVLSNQGFVELNITGWILDDGEGQLAFPLDTFIIRGARMTIAQNASLYYRDTLELADFAYGGGNSTPMIRKGGSFQLNNAGDEVLLLNHTGDVIDAFIYGSSDYGGVGWEGGAASALPKGCVAERAFAGDRFLDSNTSSDWDTIARHLVGQTRMSPATFEFDGVGMGFVSPDDSLEVMAQAINLSRTSILLNVYEFTNLRLREGLLAALDRGVDLRILVEGGPAGGVTIDEFETLRALSDAGASVRLMMDNSSVGVRARYRYDHAKYAVIDGASLIVSSENWCQSGFPAVGESGNRGWSIRLDNGSLAGFFSNLFLSDWNPTRADSIDFRDAGVKPIMGTQGDVNRYFGERFTQGAFQDRFRVTPIIGPDNTLDPGAIIGLMRSAKTSIEIEQFYASKDWGGSPNLYLEEAIAAARRGVRVRLLLDSSPYNIDENDASDNDDTIAAVLDAAASEHLPIQAKLVNSSAHGLLKVHNKGMLVDSNAVLISSLNWNLNSVTMNREIGLIVENRRLAGFFLSVFEYDWKDDVTAPMADAGGDVVVSEGTEVFFSAGGSEDDVGIATYLWDVGNDGRYELSGSLVSWRFDEPGRYVIVLRVEDAWGNTAQCSINVTVLQEEAHPSTGTGAILPMIGAIAGISVVFGCVYVLLRRKR